MKNSAEIIEEEYFEKNLKTTKEHLFLLVYIF